MKHLQNVFGNTWFWIISAIYVIIAGVVVCVSTTSNPSTDPRNFVSDYHRDIGCQNPQFSYPHSRCQTKVVSVLERKDDYEYPTGGPEHGTMARFIAIKTERQVEVLQFFDDEISDDDRSTAQFFKKYPQYLTPTSIFAAQFYEGHIVGFVFGRDFVRTGDYPGPKNEARALKNERGIQENQMKSLLIVLILGYGGIVVLRGFVFSRRTSSARESRKD